MDGRNYRPKHVELIGIINKPLLLHLVGCLYYCISGAGHTNIKFLLLTRLFFKRETAFLSRSQELLKYSITRKI